MGPVALFVIADSQIYPSSVLVMVFAVLMQHPDGVCDATFVVTRNGGLTIRLINFHYGIPSPVYCAHCVLKTVQLKLELSVMNL